MSKINFQFHATKEEIVKHILSYIKEYDLNVIIIHNFPIFEYKVYNSLSISTDAVYKADDIILTVETPVTGADNYLQLLRDNRGFLIVQIGKQDDRILKESRFAGTAEGENLKIWKMIINQFKKIMYKGAWVLDENSGMKRYYKMHMYTEGAREIYESGIKICAIAGTAKYILGDLQI